MTLQVRGNDERAGRYLRNCWYIAGWADELGEAPQARTFLEQPVALFRDGEGVARAIAGRCPHRFASLGTGKVVDGALQCPYHGLRYVGIYGAGQVSPLTPGPGYAYPLPAFPYLQNPQIPFTPRQKDGYILVAAGSDRMYGTNDDIVSFGSVQP